MDSSPGVCVCVCVWGTDEYCAEPVQASAEV